MLPLPHPVRAACAMSRLIVKNLPGYLDEARFKAHFDAAPSTAGRGARSITDVKLVRRPDGTSRRFGFIGFKGADEAQDALQYFDKTFIDTCRISVSIAKSINDEGLKEEESRRRALRHKEQDGKAGQKDKRAELSDDKASASSNKKKSISFEEFMGVMMPKSKRKLGYMETKESAADDDMNADLEDGSGQQTPQSPDEDKRTKRRRREEDDVDEGQSPIIEADKAEEAPADAVAQDETLTDMEYMYKRMRRNVGKELEEEEETKAYSQPSEDEGEEETESAAIEPTADEKKAQKEAERDERRRERQKKAMEEKARNDEADANLIMEHGRLFVRNLPFEAVEEEVEEYFSRFGKVEQVHITLDSTTKKSKGIAFVTFANSSHALAAFRSADGHTFQGRLLHILPAVQQGAAPEAKSIKDSKRETLKANAGKDFNWSTLFMNSDAVASSVAARLGIDKADILNPLDSEGDQVAGKSSMSPAVRLALAETSVINETRDFLIAEGINVDAFQETDGKSRHRSETVILVKNIPFGTTTETLQSMFERFGAVERTIMPSHGTIAVVEMQHASEAKAAFRALAYKRLGNSILYLEKAPIGMMKGKPNQASITSQPQPASVEAGATAQPPASDPTSTAPATLFVKNLSFSTTDDRLTSAFEKFGDFDFARVQRRNANKRDGSGHVRLSMGYAFVGFRSREAAQRAQTSMDKSTLDGHVLSVAFARRGHDADESEGAADSSLGQTGEPIRQAPSSKLIVKNLAFQATKKDVRSLFAGYGKIKSVRVPRKGMSNVGGTAAGVRGFGFVEFVSKSEALAAYQALRHSHLLGRHLVLEWDTEGSEDGRTAAALLDGEGAQTSAGKQEESAAIKRLRMKAAQNVAASHAAAAGGAHRREKLHLTEEDIRQAARDEQKRKEADEEEDEEDDGEDE